MKNSELRKIIKEELQELNEDKLQKLIKPFCKFLEKKGFIKDLIKQKVVDPEPDYFKSLETWNVIDDGRLYFVIGAYIKNFKPLNNYLEDNNYFDINNDEGVDSLSDIIDEVAEYFNLVW